MDTAERIKRQILKDYNRDPRGWYAITSRDARGYYDTIFLHGGEVWMLKEHPINPFESVGFGIKGQVEDIRLEGFPYTFGFRPVDRESMEELLRRTEAGQGVGEALRALLRRAPLPLEEIRTPMALGGPILVAQEPRLDLLPSLSELDRRLRLELDRLIMRRYPHIFSMYR